MNEYPEPRPSKESLIDILGLSSALLFLVVGISMVILGDNWLLEFWSWAPRTGEIILDHIGWGFSVFVPALLGFYAIVIGGQLVAAPDVASRTRRVVGLLAEVIVATLTPSLLLVVAACIANPELVGALFVVLPATGLLAFLAVQLGGFIIFDPELRLKAALQTRLWAQERLRKLRFRTKYPLWAVGLINAVLAVVVSFIATGVVAENVNVALWLVLLNAPIAIGLIVATSQTQPIFFTSRDIFGKIVAWVVPSFLNLAVVVAAVSLLFSDSVAAAGALGLFCVVAVTALSSILPRSLVPHAVWNWTIRAAVMSSAARSVARSHRAATRTIKELSPSVQDGAAQKPQGPGFTERFMAALAVLRKREVPDAS